MVRERERAMNTDWMARGKCKEVPPDTFFPSDGMGVLVAQRICAECPVSKACLEYDPPVSPA